MALYNFVYAFAEMALWKNLIHENKDSIIEI